MCMVLMFIGRFKKSESYEDIISKLMKISKEAKGPSSLCSESILAKLQMMCPSSLRKTVKLLRMGGQMSSLTHCLTMELAATRYFLSGDTFEFGVRTKLIDKIKTNTLRWPSTIGEDSDDPNEFLREHKMVAGEIVEHAQQYQHLLPSYTLPSEKEIRRLLLRYHGNKEHVKREILDLYSPHKMGINEHLNLLFEYIDMQNKL